MRLQITVVRSHYQPLEYGPFLRISRYSWFMLFLQSRLSCSWWSSAALSAILVSIPEISPLSATPAVPPLSGNIGLLQFALTASRG